MGLIKKFSAIAGLLMIIAAIANVEFGALMPLDPPQKLILARVADQGCKADEIQKELDAGNVNECVTSIGVWDAPDLLLVAEGSILLLSTFLRWPRKGRWALRIRRLAIVSGIVLCGLALADSFDKLPGTSSEELAILLPFPAPPIAVQIAIFALGIFLIRGPKYEIDYDKTSKRESKNNLQMTHAQMDSVYASGGSLGDLQKKRKRSYKYSTIGDLWQDQGLSVYEDKFESGMRDEFADETKRTCHLCNGEGCAGCNRTGFVS